MDMNLKERKEKLTISSQRGQITPWIDNIMFNPMAYGFLTNLVPQTIYTRPRSFSTDTFKFTDSNKKAQDNSSQYITEIKKKKNFSRAGGKGTQRGGKRTQRGGKGT